MKKITILLSAFISLSVQAQLMDNGLPYPDTKPGASNLEKSGDFGSFCGYSLTAAPTTNNGNDGVMFKIRAKKPIIINTFSLLNPVVSTADDFEIYTKTGDYVGFETNPAAWNMVFSTSATPVNDTITFSASLSLFMNTNETRSFYVRGLTNGVDYLNGTTEGAIFSQNAELEFFEGKGIGGLFATTNTPRVFSGIIHYCEATEFLCDTLGTQLTNSNSNDGIFFDIQAKTQNIEIDNFFLDFLDVTKSKVMVYTRNGTSVGNEGSPVGWTLVSSNNQVNPSEGSAAVAPVLSIEIPAGTTKGIHIVLDRGFIEYTNGTTVGEIAKENDFMIIRTGTGADEPFVTNNLPRKIDGRVSYCVTSNIGIGDAELAELNMFPNPTDGMVYIQTGNANIENIVVMDASGKVVYTLSSPNSNSVNINLDFLNSGVYFIRTQTANATRTDKLLKN
ncbi:MAG: T9SS type A sorting domain-containing protein [Flavobacteriales bacterium]|nr:T9SS type A sorting domain-containing protein [Flavobacteriales bacterium]